MRRVTASRLSGSLAFVERVLNDYVQDDSESELEECGGIPRMPKQSQYMEYINGIHAWNTIHGIHAGNTYIEYTVYIHSTDMEYIHSIQIALMHGANTNTINNYPSATPIKKFFHC